MRTMTYAKRKAARPATATMTMEPWTLDADPVNTDALVLGAVTLCAADGATTAAAELVGATLEKVRFLFLQIAS
jgi:hypothetical protein